MRARTARGSVERDLVRVAAYPRIADTITMLSVVGTAEYDDGIYGGYETTGFVGLRQRMTHNNSNLGSIDTVEDLVAVLLRERVEDLDCAIFLDDLTVQIEMLEGLPKNDAGVQMLFAVYTGSVSLLAHFLAHYEETKQSKLSRLCLDAAITMFGKIQMPLAFFPDLGACPTEVMAFDDIEFASGTALALSGELVYVASHGSIISIPLSEPRVCTRIQVNVPECTPYSIVHVKGVLLLSSPSIPLMRCSTSTDHAPVKIERGVIQALLRKSTLYPIVSDGQSIFSVQFDDTPRISKYSFRDGSARLQFVVRLHTDLKLQSPFSQLLPAKWRDTALMATNGVYLSVMIKAQEKVICRVFTIHDGRHVGDMNIGQEDSKERMALDMVAWTFESTRMSHFVVVGGLAWYIDSGVTVRGEAFDNMEGRGGGRDLRHIPLLKDMFVKLAVCYDGADAVLPLSMSDNEIRAIIETTLCQVIESKDFELTQALITLLPLRWSEQGYDFRRLSPVIDILIMCLSTPSFEILGRSIAVVVIQYLDIFAQANYTSTSTLFDQVLKLNAYLPRGFVLRCLRRSEALPIVVTEQSLRRVCNTGLYSPPSCRTDSTAMMLGLQHSLISNRNTLLCVYVEELVEALLFMKNSVHTDDELTGKGAHVVFTAYMTLLSSLKKIGRDFLWDFRLAELLFKVGKMSPEFEVGSMTAMRIRSLTVAFDLSCNIISKDDMFYVGENGNRLNTTGVCSDIEWSVNSIGVDDRIIDELRVIVANSNTVNMDEMEKQREVQHVINLVRTGKIHEDVFYLKCRQIEEIQPQILTNVLQFFKKEDETMIVKCIWDSPAARFMQMICDPFFLGTEVCKATFAMFLKPLGECTRHFLMLPRSVMKEFEDNVDFTLYMPSELVKRSDVRIQNVVALSACRLADCLPSIECFRDCVAPFSPKFTKFDLVNSATFTAIGFICGFPVNIDVVTLFRDCIGTGALDAVHSGMMILHHMSVDSRFEMCVSWCIDAVNLFMTGEQHLFLGQQNGTKCFEISLIICDHLRHIFNSIPLEIMDFVNTNNGNVLVMLMILASDIDMVREHAELYRIGLDGRIQYGEVMAHDEKRAALRRSLNDRCLVSLEEYAICESRAKYVFDLTRVRDLSALKKAMFEYEPSVPMMTVFKYAAISRCCTVDAFRELLSSGDKEHLMRVPRPQTSNITDVLNDFAGAFSYSETEMMTFFFQTTLSFSDFLPMRVDPLTNRSSGVLMSFSSGREYVFAPLHSRCPAKMTLAINSATHGDPPLVASIWQVGKARKRFCSHELVGFGHTESGSSLSQFFAIIPEKGMIMARTAVLGDIYLHLEPSCDMVFVTVGLSELTVVNCELELGTDFDITIDENPRVEVSLCSKMRLPKFPLALSSVFWRAHVESIVSILQSHYTETGLFALSRSDRDIFFHVVLRVMFHGDADPLSTDFLIQEKYVKESLREIRKNTDDVTLLCNRIMERLENDSRLFSDGMFTGRNRSTTVLHPRDAPDRLCQGYGMSGRRLVGPNHLLSDISEPLFLFTGDISDTILEFVVNVRHFVAIIFFVSRSNKFMYDMLARLVPLTRVIPFNSLVVDVVKSISVTAEPLLDHNLSISSWLAFAFPSYFEENVHYPKANLELIFEMGLPELCFPLTSFVKCFLRLNAKEIPFDEVGAPVTFRLDNGAVQYLVVQSYTTDAQFVIKTRDGKQVQEVQAGREIVMTESFSIENRKRLRDTMLCTHTLTPANLLASIKAFASWKLNWSHQLCLYKPWEITGDVFDDLPLSSRIGFDIGVCCCTVLQNEKLSILRHHMKGSFTDFCQPLEPMIARFEALFPNVDITSLASQKPATDECFAAATPIILSRGKPLCYTIDYSVWCDICRPGSNLNMVMRSVSCCWRAIHPFPFRTECAHSNKSGIMSAIIWINVDDDLKWALTDYIDRIPLLVVLQFVEWVTGEWGVPALMATQERHMVILSSDCANAANAHRSSKTLEVRRFANPVDVIEAIKSGVQDFFDDRET